MLQGQCFKVRIARKAELRVCAYDVKTAVKFDGPPLSGFFKTSNRQLAGLHVGKGSSLTSAQLGIDLDEAGQVFGTGHKAAAGVDVGIQRNVARQQRTRLGQLFQCDLKTNGCRPGVLDKIASHTRRSHQADAASYQ